MAEPQFITDGAREEYERMLGRTIARERGLLPTVNDGYILMNIQERGWEQFCEVPEPVPVNIIREFYANASVNKNGISQVRGFRVDYQPPAIRRVCGLPGRSRERVDWSGMTREGVDLQMIIQSLCVPGTEWKLKVGTTEPKTFPSAALNRIGRAWHLFICANIVPTSHSHEVTVDRAILLYAICNREYVDLGNLIHQGMLRFMQGPSSAIVPYGSVITRLVRECGVRWLASEGVQQPVAALDHQSIWRLPEKADSSPNLWGLGYREEDQQQQQGEQQQVEPQEGGSVVGSREYRRLMRRIDAVHEMQAGFAANFDQFAQVLGTALRASGLDVTFPSLAAGAGATYPPPDTPEGSDSAEE